jgi:hypothetical protein
MKMKRQSGSVAHSKDSFEEGSLPVLKKTRNVK